MAIRATGTFDLDSWDEQSYDEREGARLTRTRVTKTFHGDIQGTSTAELLMAYAQEEGSAAYVGFERVIGRVHGSSGSFVLHHNATATRRAQSATFSVVPDTGTGELRGLNGHMEIVRAPDGKHSFVLEYDLD